MAPEPAGVVWADGVGSAPAGFEPVPPTLEDAYLLLMRSSREPDGAQSGIGTGVGPTATAASAPNTASGAEA